MGRQAQTFQDFTPRDDLKVRRVNRNDFRAPGGIQQVRPIQLMREGLAIVAIASEASRCVARKIPKLCAEGAALALNLHYRSLEFVEASRKVPKRAAVLGWLQDVVRM
jgi:hypothetical protein